MVAHPLMQLLRSIGSLIAGRMSTGTYMTDEPRAQTSLLMDDRFAAAARFHPSACYCFTLISLHDPRYMVVVPSKIDVPDQEPISALQPWTASQSYHPCQLIPSITSLPAPGNYLLFCSSRPFSPLSCTSTPTTKPSSHWAPVAPPLPSPATSAPKLSPSSPSATPTSQKQQQRPSEATCAIFPHAPHPDRQREESRRTGKSRSGPRQPSTNIWQPNYTVSSPRTRRGWSWARRASRSTAPASSHAPPRGGRAGARSATHTPRTARCT